MGRQRLRSNHRHARGLGCTGEYAWHEFIWRDRLRWQIGRRAQYEEKYDAFLTTIRAAVPEKPILCVTPILNRADLQTGATQTATAENSIAKGLFELCAGALFLLVTDYVHPNDAG